MAAERANSGVSSVAVIDTNVWLDLFVFEDRAARPLAQALQRGAVRVIRSMRTDAELLAVLARPKFGQRLPPNSIAVLLCNWQSLAHCVDAGGSAPWLCADPDDQKFLDLAYSSRVQALFTKDRALLRLAHAARKHGLQIVQPTVLGGSQEFVAARPC